jgi:hypothetical protein
MVLAVACGMGYRPSEGGGGAVALIWTPGSGWATQAAMTVDPTDPAAQEPSKPRQPSLKDLRLERQKAALKANMARRKAQVRAKAGQNAVPENNEKEE